MKLIKLIEILTNLLNLIYQKIATVDRPSPRDIIKPENIEQRESLGTVTITGLNGIWVTGVADTNSMDGLLDYGHSVILISEFDRDDLRVGDIVVFQGNKGRIIHRIVSIGKHIRTRGDNVAFKDPYKLKKEDIEYLCVGIIY